MTSENGTHTDTPIRTDVLIVGAGPVGLFAAFEAGVVGLSCQIVDTLGRIGGQCIELYPDKPIYDIPAVPSCTARELVDRLMEQCRPFDPPIHLNQRVETVDQRDDGRWTVTTGQGLVFDIPAVPSCTARELVDRLMEQCRPFDPPIHLNQRVETVDQRDD
ncbi:NAD(P)/FAD-dependent oxidoreductase, partial [Caballeronia sp. M23-90]